MSVQKEKYINSLTDFEGTSAAEIAKFSTNEREAYEDSLKYYRDIKNIVDTSWEEGKIEGKVEIARQMKKEGFQGKQISLLTGLSISEIDKL